MDPALLAEELVLAGPAEQRHAIALGLEAPVRLLAVETALDRRGQVNRDPFR